MIRQTLYKVKRNLPDGYYMKIGRVQKRPGPRNREYAESTIFKYPGSRVMDLTSKVDFGAEYHTGFFVPGRIAEALDVAKTMNIIQSIYGPDKFGDTIRVPIRRRVTANQ